MNSYGSESMGMGSTVFAGNQSQPGDAARQPFLVIDLALSGPLALSALPGQSFHSATVHGDTPMEVEMGSALSGPLGSPTMPDPRSISLPGISLLSVAQPSLSGVRPPPGFTGTPMGSGEFSGSGKRQPSGRHRPSTLVGLRPLPNRTTATITSVTAPAATMASYGGVSTSTLLGRPISSHSPEQPGLGPLGATQQQWSGSIPQGVQLPYTHGTNEIPMEQALSCGTGNSLVAIFNI